MGVRWLPCGCVKCCQFDSGNCERLSIVGQFKTHEQRVIGQAGIAARHECRRRATAAIAANLKVDNFVAVAPIKELTICSQACGSRNQ